MCRTGRWLVVVWLGVVGALYEEAEHVVSGFGSVSEFEAAVLTDDSKVWLVSVYAGSECEACEAIEGEFAAASAELGASLGVLTAAVDVSSGVGAKIGKKLGIGRVPSIVGFGGRSSTNPYTHKPTRDMVVWQDLLRDGHFKVSDLKRWVGSKVLPNDETKKGTAAAAEARFKGLPTAVLVTERSTTSALLKSLAVALRDRIALIELGRDEASDDLADDQDELPKLVALKKDDGAVDETYGGSLKDRDGILAWLETKALPERLTAQQQKQKDDAHTDDQDDAKKDDEQAGPFGKAYSAATVSSPAELGTQKIASAVIVAPVDAVSADDDSSAAAKTLAGVDGAGVVKAVRCGRNFEGGCEGGWQAFAAGGRHLGRFKTAKEALEKAVETVPSSDVSMLGAGLLDGFMQRAVSGSVSDAGSESTTPAMGLLIFSLKEDVSLHVRAVAKVLAETVGIPVGQYVVDPDSAEDADVLRRFSVAKAPAVVAFHGQAPDGSDPSMPPGAVQLGIAPFERRVFGPVSFRSLVMFAQAILQPLDSDASQILVDFVLDESSASRPRADSSSSNTKKRQAKKTPPGELADVAAVGGLAAAGCGTDAQLCAVFLLDQTGRADTFETELAVAKDVARAEASAPYGFAWFDGQCHLDVALAFDVDPMKLPTLVAYAPKKGRFAAYVGQFNAKELKSFLRGVVSGRIPTAPLRVDPLPDVDVSKDCLAAASLADDDLPVPDAQDADIDDFMAEILAEEQAKKAAVEAEAKAELERLAEEKRQQALAEKASAKKPKPKKKKKKTTKKSSTASDL